MLYEVLYHRDAEWKVGETKEEHFARLNGDVALLDSERYPDDYPGKVIAIRPVRDVITNGKPSLRDMADKDWPCITMELTQAQADEIACRKSKIDTTNLLVKPTTLEDRWGAVAETLRNQFPDPEEVESNLRVAPLSEEVKRFKEISLLARRALAPTITNTGTGYYAVKASPTKNDDTQSGAPAGQVITLVTGGLGTADAFKGGYVLNVTRSETRAIVSHTDGTVTLEGSLANWLDTDDLDIYDSWSTIQAANDQLNTDQGGTLFSAAQVIRIYSGTYTEVVTTSGFNTDADAGFILVIEGDPAAARTAIVVDGVAGGTTFTIQAPDTLIRHFTIDAPTYVLYGTNGVDYMLVYDMKIDATGGTDNAIWQDGNRAIIENCEIIGNNSEAFLDSAPQGGSVALWGCTLSSSTGGGTAISLVAAQSAFIGGCIFDDFAIGIAATSDKSVVQVISNCTFYSCSTAAIQTSDGQGLRLFNNIFHSNVLNIDAGGEPDEASDAFCPKIYSHNNYYYNETNHYNAGAAGNKTYAQFAAYDRVDSTNDVAGTDPLLTDPANGDFSLASGSPCINAGRGTGVITGANGVDFDANEPDIGAWSSGEAAAAAGRTWMSMARQLIGTEVYDGKSMNASSGATKTIRDMIGATDLPANKLRQVKRVRIKADADFDFGNSDLSNKDTHATGTDYDRECGPEHLTNTYVRANADAAISNIEVEVWLGT